MALSNRSYVSVFKIDGMPILPPVIDENRRIELNQDRLLAIEIERKLQLKRTHRSIPNETIMGNAVANSNNFGAYNDGLECNGSNYDTSAAVDSLFDDNAQSHHDEAPSNRGHDVENWMHSSLSDVSDTTKSPKVAALTLSIDSNFDSITPKNQSPGFSLHSSPSVDALNESRNISLYFTPTAGRESVSPIPVHKLTPPRLIRSNSYTLDKPSPMLLKHMANNFTMNPTTSIPAGKSPMGVSRFQNNQTNASSSIPRKSKHNGNASRPSSTKTTSTARPSSNASSSSKYESLSNGSSKSNSIKSTKSNKSQTNPASVFKNSESLLRSIYGQKPKVKVEHSAKKNTSSTTLASESAHQSIEKSHINDSISSNQSNSSINKVNPRTYNQILAVFEQQHAALLKRQQDEQKRMQEEFLRQQQELLQKMQILIANKNNAEITPNGGGSSISDTQPKKSNEKMLVDEVNNEVPVIVDSNGNRVNRFTPESGKCIRRLRYDEQKLNLNGNNGIDICQLSPTKLSTDGSDQFEMYTVEEVRAASIIVAHSKGYLVRRLLKTKKVLELRKMHYDTLELLLDISEEDNKNESKSDVEFKFNLLQQLASVGAELYEIFFQLPLVERMNIICKDRMLKEQQNSTLNRSKSASINGKKIQKPRP